ncbi:TPA: hypothetical protein PXP52_001021 [Yersinia enterocolitica]|nr:hypothetical protein [Yersinia enterocolitica]
MNNGTIKNAQITCETGSTVLQATCLNVAQETLQQLLASELTGKRPYPILYKQGDIEQRAIELAEAVGSAFTALDCLPGQLSGLHDRAQIVDDLSLEVFHHINVLLKRITGSDSKCGEDPEERKRPSNVINRTEHFVANAETTLKSAIINLREIHEALDNSIMTLGVDITAATSTTSMEFNPVMGMDGRYNWHNINAYDHHLKFLIPTVEDVSNIFNEVLSEVREWKLTSNNTCSLLNEIHNRVLKRISITLKFIGE